MYRFLSVKFPLCRVVRPWFSIKCCLFCGFLILDRSFAKPSNDVLYQLSRVCVRLGEVEYLLITYQPCCYWNYYLMLSLQHVLKIQRNNPSFQLFPHPVNSNTSASIGFMLHNIMTVANYFRGLKNLVHQNIPQKKGEVKTQIAF